MVFYSETFSTHYVALSEIPYSAWGFQDFLNSVKNAVLMPENAKKNHKEIGYPVVPCIRPDFDWLFDIYLFIDMKNSKSKDEEKISNYRHVFYVGCLENVLGEKKSSVAVLRLKLLGFIVITIFDYGQRNMEFEL